MRRALLILILSACSREAPHEAPAREVAETPELDGRARVLIEQSAAGRPPAQRHKACVELGRLGGNAARDRLLELLAENTRDAAKDGRLHLYAAAGLTLLADPGTAIDLLEALSRINPNDNVAALASEARNEEYVTVDAQLCDALLKMGLWDVEEELVEQLRRRHRIRVLIDAYAVLRRRTGLNLQFRYNGAYADKDADADRWQEALRATRAQRHAKQPFDAEHPRFRERCAQVVGWLGGQSVTHRLMAHKILDDVGLHAVPYLVEELRTDNRIAQRQAAYMLGRLGAKEATGALRDALALDDADARAEAVGALLLLGDKSARTKVLPLLADRDPEVRAAAARYLGRLGEEADKDTLVAGAARETAPAARTALMAAALRLGDRTQVQGLVAIYVEG